MRKTIFEEMGGTYIRHGDYPYPLPYLVGGRTEDYRRMGTKTFMLSERISQECIFEPAYKWGGLNDYLANYRRTGTETL